MLNHIMLKPPLFNSIKSGRVSEMIVDEIWGAIRQGKIRPGDKLPSEHSLIEMFQVSKFSVREALRSLEMLGLLAIRKGAKGGAFVTEMNFEPIKNSLLNFLQSKNISVRNISEVRRLIETGTVELAAVRRSKKDIDLIQNRLEEAQKKLDQGERISDLNIEFHLAIAEASYNPILALTLDYVFDLLRKSIAILRPDKESEFSAWNTRDHWKIFKAIREADPKRAKEAMAHHLKEVEKRLKPIEDGLNLKFGRTNTISLKRNKGNKNLSTWPRRTK